MTDVSLEEERLAAFEKGYQAGWDDCVKSQIEDGRRITADLVQNLQDLSFTYEEVHAGIMAMMHPLLQQMTTAVLPALSQAMLVPRITEILHDLIAAHGRQPVRIVAGPDDISVLERLGAELPDLPCEISEDPTLLSGQVYLRFGESEHAIDMQDVLHRIDQAVSGFFMESRKAVA
jgi:flagellar assembly protein FliH